MLAARLRRDAQRIVGIAEGPVRRERERVRCERGRIGVRGRETTCEGEGVA
jgi:hypothetical protein